MQELSKFVAGGITAVLLLSACAGKPQPQVHPAQRIFPSMGSELRLTVWTSDEVSANAVFDSIEDEFERLEDLMSTWRDGSEIQKLNAMAGKHPVQMSGELRDLFRNARQISDWTEGKFDVTFGAMSGLWKFDYQNKDNSVPNSDEVMRRKKFINYRDLEIDDKAGTVFLRREGMVANLGGIGKGYAVDRARDVLRERGFRDFLIQFGGDLYAAGRNGTQAWRLGIQDPRGPANRIFAAMDVMDATFSTSGDYERFFIKDGHRYHHIIDPATGNPATGTRSVTIITKDATIADGLSTGVFIMGAEAGMALIERLPDVEGVIVSAKNEVLVSSGLKGRVTLIAQPTDAP